MTADQQLRMPDHLIERARALIGDPDFDWQVPPCRDAATVVLATDLTTQVHVYLQRRVRTMAFAAGMYVFPGGAVEPTDIADAAAVADAASLPFDRSGELPGVDSLPARFAAVRETEEEAAIDLGDPTALAYISHWVTPEVEDRRFDTRFYAANVDAAAVNEASTETDAQLWLRPIDALRQYADGTIKMLPPTVAVLSEFAALAEQGYDSAAAIAELAERPVLPLMPAPYRSPDGTLGWQLVNFRTGSVVTKMPAPPAGSEVHGDRSELQ